MFTELTDRQQAVLAKFNDLTLRRRTKYRLETTYQVWQAVLDAPRGSSPEGYQAWTLAHGIARQAYCDAVHAYQAARNGELDELSSLPDAFESDAFEELKEAAEKHTNKTHTVKG